jgi:hypothetical protein
MKVIQINDVELEGTGGIRGGSGHHARRILNDEVLGRDPDRLDNFYFGVSYVGKGEFHTPRHRHDFSQYRYMIRGEADYHVGELQTDGVLNYSPEGAFYGPQKDGAGIMVNCQFGDASGNGFIGRKQLKAGAAALRQRNEGVFEDGLYVRNPGLEGKPVQDSNEAIFEFIRGRPVVYPPTGYLHTILVNSNGIPWMPIEGAAGVSEKDMGTFGLCRYRVARFKVEPGATFVAKGRGIYFVLSGQGRVGGEPFEEHTTTYLEEHEQAPFTARETADILFYGLPTLSAIEKASEALRLLEKEQTSTAAEPLATK